MAFDVMDYYSGFFALELPRGHRGHLEGYMQKEGCVSVTLDRLQGHMALKISQEVDMRVFPTAIMLLLLLLSLACLFGVGATAREWHLDAQAGLNAAEVGIAYASFVLNVYRAAMRPE